MARYRNTGASFTREDGTRWESGAVHEPTARELAMRLRKLALVKGEEPEEEPAEPDPLAGVAFGSSDAEELARDEEMTASDFEGELGTGEGHAFLVGDVRRLIEGEG